MYRIKDFDSWDEYHGAAEGSGRSEKIWLINQSKNKIGLFKYPKNVKGVPVTTEFVSEHFAQIVANRLGMPCAEINIGTRNSKIGCMSYSFLDKGDEIIHGVDFITNLYPNYDPDKMYDRESNTYYSLDMIIDSITAIFKTSDDRTPILSNIVSIMIFDMVIGNTDRHQNNWGIKVNFKEKYFSFAPFYDNGSSLCCYINENNIDDMLGNDIVRYNALVDSKSTSRIRIDGKVKKEPKHTDVMRYLYNKNPIIFKKTFEDIVNKLDSKWIDAMLDNYPEEILSKNRKILISKFLNSKMGLLKQIASI